LWQFLVELRHRDPVFLTSAENNATLMPTSVHPRDLGAAIGSLTRHGKLR
jgi:hypothetical protein